MLDNIRLRNFKRFRDADLSIGSLTLLMGVNGAGKSTVIQSILLARQSVSSGALREGFLQLSGELTQIGTGKDVLHEGAGTDEAIEITFSESGKVQVSICAKYDASSDRLPLTSEINLAQKTSLSADTFIYLGAERYGPRLSTPLSGAKAAARHIGANGEGTLAVLNHYRHTFLSDDDPRVLADFRHSIEDQTQAYLAQISPGVRLDVTAHSELDSVSAAFSFAAEGGVRTASFRPTNVGFGISYSLPIIVACLVAVPGTILIVENPEAHLHTIGQRYMAELLAKTAEAGVQVIVESHSRELFHHFRKISVSYRSISNTSVLHYFEMRNVGDVSTIDVHTLHPMCDNLTKWPSGFFDAFGSPTDLIRHV